jgi:hypothetical protein
LIAYPVQKQIKITKMQKKFRPFYDIAFDFKTCLSVEDAVLAMLGWTHKPYREVTREEEDFNHRVYCGESQEGDEIYYEKLSLFDVLKEVHEDANADYMETKEEFPDDEGLNNEKLNNINKSFEFIETAYLYYCAIEDELAKGEESELRIDKSKSTEDHYITVMSLAKWAEKTYQIKLFNKEKMNLNDLGITQEEIIENTKGGARKIDATDLQITFALLIEKYAELGNKYRHSDGRPNNSNLYKDMSDFIENSSDVSGMQERTIVERINQAQSVRHGKADGHLSLLKQKRLQINLACFTDAYAAKTDCLNNGQIADLTKIAEKLADESIARQDAESIKQRLEEAYAVRKNPDKPRS